MYAKCEFLYMIHRICIEISEFCIHIGYLKLRHHRSRPWHRTAIRSYATAGAATAGRSGTMVPARSSVVIAATGRGPEK